MSDGQTRSAVSAEGAGLVCPDLGSLTAALASIERSVPEGPGADAARLELIRELETLKCATEAAQAAVSVDFAVSQFAAQAAAGVPASRQGRGIAAQVGLARRESVHRGVFHLGLARLVMADLPHVAGAWRAGRVTEHRVQKVAAQVCVLARPDRLALDARLAGTPKLVTALEAMGDRRVEARATALAYELDKQAFVQRRVRAVSERHTSLRPAPDAMTWFSGLVTLKDGVAMHASLSAAATRARAAGDPRSTGQVMADVLVDRVTGRTEESPVPVHVEVVVPVDVVTGVGEHADASGWAPAYGPVPADVAREWAEHAATYTRIWADAATGQVVGTESRSASRCFPAGLARFARRRDRTRRMPWCDAPIRHIDHTVPAASGGQTSAQNAGGVCEAHNYAKQAPGWVAETARDPDGTHVITYTTPTGHRWESRPPPAYPPRE